MFKVLSNLKESIIYVLIVISLLVLQAWCDLTLPDFTSKIVNTGIQAGGIENAVPKILPKNIMDSLLQFTEDDNEILDNYMINGSVLTAEQEDMIKQYLGKDANPQEETIYILRKINNKEEEQLSKIMVDPLVTVAAIMSKQEENNNIDISTMEESVKQQVSVTVVKEL